jgi:nucleotide sugar dehydrogenase
MKLYSRFSPEEINISVYGLGKMGLPLAVAFASKGFNVIGVDTNKTVVDRVNNSDNPITGEQDLDSLLAEVVKLNKLNATTDGVEASKKTDIKIIIVPTYLDEENNPDLSIVTAVTKTIAKGLQKGDIVILESTAPPGTTLNLIGRILEKESGLTLNKDFGVAHCPERTNSGTAISDILGRLNPKVVGGSDSTTLEIVKTIYSIINSRGVVPVSDTSTAEMVKVSEGLYRDMNIAFANNLYLICNELGINTMEVINAANTDAVCHILSPGPGVGGHCIPVYPYFILKNISHNKKLLELGRKINDSMSQHVINLAEDVLNEHNIEIKKANILVLGIAYRGGVKETRKSPGLKIALELQEVAANTFVFDPLFSKQETEKYGLIYKDNYVDIDCVILATEHNEFKNLDWEKIGNTLRTKCIVDTKRILNKNRMKSLGYTLRTIGYAS